MAQVVKLEPGDILVIGNCGDLTDSDAAVVERFFAAIGINRILMFAGDIELSSAPVGGTPDAVAGA
jgi:hypothetical protein